MKSPAHLDRKMITSGAAMERRFIREMLDATLAALRSKRVGAPAVDAPVVRPDLIAATDEIQTN